MGLFDINKLFNIECQKNGSRSPCLIIGEVAQAHDGSLSLAHAFIDAIANAGADAVKFQTHIADAESTPDEPWRIKFSLQDISRYDYWRRMEFTKDQWYSLAEHANSRGLLFLSSPFSITAARLLQKVGVAAWKVASGEITNWPMLDCMAESGLPFLLSTGMSPIEEIDTSVNWFKVRNLPFLVFQCTTSYPCPPEKVGLNMLPFFKERYNCPIGLSDHSGTIFPGLAATTLGIQALEVHVTLSREMSGPDVHASVTTRELKQLVEGVHFIEKMCIQPVDKNQMAVDMIPLRNLFTKSLVADIDLKSGTILRKEFLAAKKPGTGIPISRLNEFIGRKLIRDIAANEQLLETDVE